MKVASPMRESVFQPRENVGNAAQPGLAPDCLQRPLRSRFRQQGKPSVRLPETSTICQRPAVEAAR
jgi:hypothetical protein